MDDNARILAEIAKRMAALPEEEQRRIMSELQKRLDKGRREYGHGVRIRDPYDWREMALEEVLDGMVYIAAALLRIREGERNAAGCVAR